MRIFDILLIFFYRVIYWEYLVLLVIKRLAYCLAHPLSDADCLIRCVNCWFRFEIQVRVHSCYPGTVNCYMCDCHIFRHLEPQHRFEFTSIYVLSLREVFIFWRRVILAFAAIASGPFMLMIYSLDNFLHVWTTRSVYSLCAAVPRVERRSRCSKLVLTCT